MDSKKVDAPTKLSIRLLSEKNQCWKAPQLEVPAICHLGTGNHSRGSRLSGWGPKGTKENTTPGSTTTFSDVMAAWGHACGKHTELFNAKNEALGWRDSSPLAIPADNQTLNHKTHFWWLINITYNSSSRGTQYCWPLKVLVLMCTYPHKHFKVLVFEKLTK